MFDILFAPEGLASPSLSLENIYLIIKTSFLRTKINNHQLVNIGVSEIKTAPEFVED